MTIKDLKDQDLIILECISGSKAYGLDTPQSDTDIKGVFILPRDLFYAGVQLPQVADETNDTVYYELGRFIELLEKNNPNILELLATPSNLILKKHPLMDLLSLDLFLSKKCKKSFGNYASSQIKKAQGLNKKINNPMGETKKFILEFCYVLFGQGSVPLSSWLDRKEMAIEKIGLINIDHARGAFAMFYDDSNSLNYKGVVSSPESQMLCLSSIPKGEAPVGHLFFNQDGYTKYCKDYKEYWSWVKKRNESRYLSNISNERNYDAKNMMHTFRLLDMAIEILRDGEVNVYRKNRAELLAIRNGDWTFEELLAQGEEKIIVLEAAYQNSHLPEGPDSRKIQKLLIDLRKKFFHHQL